MRTMIALVLTASIFWAPKVLAAGDAVIPPYVAYQSALFDDGGNPIPDGQADITFRISDALGQVLYEEHQTLDVTHGQISALIGNGLTPDGAPAGGIPVSALDPIGARYLEVEVGGMPPSTPMEIASVPYSTYAWMSLSAGPDSVTSGSIVDGAIVYEDLNAELISRILNELTAGRGPEQMVYREDLNDLYRQPTAAASIGVRPGFIYSGANDLQGVLKDLDIAIKRRDERIEQEKKDRSASATEEAAARSTADSALQASMAGESAARVSTDSALQSNITSESTARAGADSALQTGINGEASDRAAADALRVSKVGDSMSGALDMGGNQVNNIGAPASGSGAARKADVDAAKQEVTAYCDGASAAISNTVTQQLRPNAWGSVAFGSELGNTVFNGANAGFVPGQVLSSPVRIVLDPPLAGANYAVIVTLQSMIAGQTWNIWDKQADGFYFQAPKTIGGLGNNASFDFIVIGP